MYTITVDMRLLSSLLALWVTGVSVAYGYSMPGGYERVLFYYAYVAECAESNNSPSKIGAGCATAPRTCNFNQFMEYIMTEVSALQKTLWFFNATLRDRCRLTKKLERRE